MFYLNLNQMAFMAKHGVLASEKLTAQKFLVDVKIETDQIVTAAVTDHIDDALNYVAIYELIQDIMLNQQYDLIETIAMKIATTLVKTYPVVISVDTKVTKVNPPIDGFIGTVSCEYCAFGSE
ncbi:MAG: dihydroneopterin aldolase [Defluviitaleaceae bacterium]|nr:dihydroneopterin aldolase [Defluviitaleaceae bacterium]